MSFSETERIEHVLDELWKSLDCPLWGIRNKESGRFIVVGLMKDRLLFGDAMNWIQAKFWTDKSCAEEVWEIMSKDESFKASHFVDKLSEYESNMRRKEIIGF